MYKNNIMPQQRAELVRLGKYIAAILAMKTEELSAGQFRNVEV